MFIRFTPIAEFINLQSPEHQVHMVAMKNVLNFFRDVNCQIKNRLFMSKEVIIILLKIHFFKFFAFFSLLLKMFYIIFIVLMSFHLYKNIIASLVIFLQLLIPS